MILKTYKKFERLFSSAKFAVGIISAFAIALAYGTFMESYHGTEFANRLVYKSWWFMAMQGLMFLSILMATLVRLPPKKRLYGFYTIHAGLIIIFIGAFFTYINGIDGSIELRPNLPSNRVIINEELLKIQDESGKVTSYELPFKAGPIKIDTQHENVKIKEFYPSSTLKTVWKEAENGANEQSGQYLIFNDNVSQDFILSLSPNSDFQSTLRMGLLNIHYMPARLFECFSKPSKSGFIIWNIVVNECFSPEEKNYSLSKTDRGNRFLLIPYQGEMLNFFPDFSPLAVDNDFNKRGDTPFRVFSKKLFEERPNLFIFGKKISYYHKRKNSWVGKEFTDAKPLKLPWMNFKLRLLQHHDNKVPYQIPVYIRPVQDKGEIIEGNIKAVKIEFYGKDYWVRSDAPLVLEGGKRRVQFSISPRQIMLPYQMTLNNFEMKRNPGTNDPASYESFVSLLDGRTDKGAQEFHVYMNNPLKYDDFTFYQSSYFSLGRDSQGNEAFGSVLSVNYDPGRPFKYLGSFLLVFGSIWHFVLRRKRKKKAEVQNSQVQSLALGESNA